MYTVEAISRQLAKSIQDDKTRLDYWNLQAYMHLQQFNEKIKTQLQITNVHESLRNAIIEANTVSDREYEPAKNYMKIYQQIVRAVGEEDYGSNTLSLANKKEARKVAKAFFEVDKISFDVLSVLERINQIKLKNNEGGVSPIGLGIVEFHKKLLNEYTFVSNAVIQNPNSVWKELGSISGVGFDTTLHGRIPYRYIFFDMKGDGRQVPQSLGCPVMHTNLGASIRLNPIFEFYVESNLSPHVNELENLDYVYINLQRHHDGFRPEVKSEFVRSEELHKSLNSKEGAACVSLPAYSEYFNQGLDTHTGKSDSSFESINSMFNSIVDSISKSTNDFVIPDKVLRIMYIKAGIKKAESSTFNLRSKVMIDKLIRKSYEQSVLSVTGSSISKVGGKQSESSVRAAIMSYFVKGTLTDQILDATNPKRYNITCKDAIDRAGTHNLILGIYRKIKAGTEIYPDEIEKSLNGLAMAYKHRPINHQGTVFFNTFEKIYYAMNQSQREKIFPLDESGKPWPENWLNRCSPLKPSFVFECINTKSPSLYEQAEPSSLTNKMKKLLGKDYEGTLNGVRVECSKKMIRVFPGDDYLISDKYSEKGVEFLQKFSKTLNFKNYYLQGKAIGNGSTSVRGRGQWGLSRELESYSSGDHLETGPHMEKATKHNSNSNSVSRAELTASKQRKEIIAYLEEQNIQVASTKDATGTLIDMIAYDGIDRVVMTRAIDEDTTYIATESSKPEKDDVSVFAECIIASGCDKPVLNKGNPRDVIKVLEYLKKSNYQCNPIIGEGITDKCSSKQAVKMKKLVHEFKEPYDKLGISRDNPKRRM